jgi:hypothetical protein
MTALKVLANVPFYNFFYLFARKKFTTRTRNLRQKIREGILAKLLQLLEKKDSRERNFRLSLLYNEVHLNRKGIFLTKNKKSKNLVCKKSNISIRYPIVS